MEATEEKFVADVKYTFGVLKKNGLLEPMSKKKFGIVYGSIRKKEGLIRFLRFYKFGVHNKLIYHVPGTEKGGQIHFNHKLIDDNLESNSNTFKFPEHLKLCNQRVSFKKKLNLNEPLTGRECLICKAVFKREDDYMRHIESNRHVQLDKYRKTRSFFEKIKEVVIEIENGSGNKHENVNAELNKEKIVMLNIINNSLMHFDHISYEVLNEKLKGVQLEFSNEASLPAEGFLSANLVAKFTEMVADDYLLLLILREKVTQKFFYVIKAISFVVTTNVTAGLLPKEPYKKPSKVIIKENHEEVIPGLVLTYGAKKEKDVLRLKDYHIPKAIVDILNFGFKEMEYMSPHTINKLKFYKKLLKPEFNITPLTSKNYYEMLNFLLFAEEHQMNIDIRNYDMVSSLDMTPNGMYRLQVPGLAEKRPSVLVGDTVFATEPNGKKKYSGTVHLVELNSVLLGFDRRFTSEVLNKQKLQISFSISRRPLRLEHQALELTKTHRINNILFPVKPQLILEGSNEPRNFNWFNRNIGDNAEQMLAINRIFDKSSNGLPYIIFGPPGTGKTSTLVEAVLQIYKNKPNSNILVCAPSNYASDVIALRLMKVIVSKMEILRYVGMSVVEIKEELKPICNKIGQDYYFPTLTEIKTKRIVVATNCTAARMVNAGIPFDHFDYVFIDEAGQCTETETLLPIVGMITNEEIVGKSQVVLVGDPQQLGPVLHSPLVQKFKFGMSLLERLMKTNDIYKPVDKKYNSTYITKLINNYRSHETIIAVSNKLFYDNELKAKGDNFIHLFENWDHLPNKKFPVIYHHVSGKEMREGNSPSWFNLSEIDVIVSYIDKILDSKVCGTKIQQREIGVITAYRKQCSKLRSAFKTKKWFDITVGTVEMFQGQERLVTIVSTVRSNTEFLDIDNKFHLGFLKNPKRFNVSMTRAKSLLIVVGNANILQLDPVWHEFISYCKNNKAVGGKGFSLLEKPSDIDEIDINLANLNLKDHVQGDHINFSRNNE